MVVSISVVHLCDHVVDWELLGAAYPPPIPGPITESIVLRITKREKIQIQNLRYSFH